MENKITVTVPASYSFCMDKYLEDGGDFEFMPPVYVSQNPDGSYKVSCVDEHKLESFIMERIVCDDQESCEDILETAE